MTPRQVSVLARAAAGFGYEWAMKGTSLGYEHQRGCDRQVKWLIGRGLAYKRGDRLIANASSRKVLEYQHSASQ